MLQLLAMVSCSVALLFGEIITDLNNLKVIASIVSRLYNLLIYIFLLLYLCSWLHLCKVFYTMFGSLYHMQKKRFLKYTKPVGWIYERFFHKAFYEKNYRPRNAFKLSLFDGIDVTVFQKIKMGGTILLLYDDMFDYSKLIAKFIKNTIAAGETVDYITTYKSPVELCRLFSDSEIPTVSKRLSIIDCFTPHYGFDDKVVKYAMHDFEQKGFVFYSASSFAEVHTAANNSWYRFRKVCKNEENLFRIPHRTVYDTLSSLISFSSEELYLLFLRHVASSEKSYGMISIITEPQSLKAELKNDLIRMADIVLECKQTDLTILK